jgi:hypothetical protein
MYLNVCACIYMYPVCIFTYMHVFVRIQVCMYAISTEKMLSILHDCVHDLGIIGVCIVCILYIFAYVLYVYVSICRYFSKTYI